MRGLEFLTTASLLQAGLASAIPSLRHQNLHADRRDVSPVIETVTTTFYQTVVWVDSNGKPVSTEINTPPPAATPPKPTGLPTGLPTDYKKRPGVPPGGSKPQSPSSFAPPVPSQVASPVPTPAPPTESSADSSASPSQDAPKSSEEATSGGTGDSQSGAVPAGAGICYDMINSQTQCKDPGTINSEFSFLKSQGYGMIRVYDIGCPVGDFTAAAAQNGLKLMVGINSIANLQGDLNKLIDMVNGNWGAVDTVYIGNELVNTGQASAAQVAGAVSTAKGTLTGAGFSGSVITVDTFNVMMNDPTICSTSDYCGANAHAFFDPNTAAPNAGPFVLDAFNKVAAANPGKQIVITESGWPYQGNANGQAVPSPENQQAALQSIKSSLTGAGAGAVFLFQAYNAGYKAPGPLGVEQFFGIYGH